MQGARENNSRLIKIFVGSPNDMAGHRESLRKAVERLNGLDVMTDHLKYVDWQTDADPAPGRIQDVILDHIGPYDIFVGIFGHRLGSPTGKAVSGTVEEYEAAYELHERDGVPGILIYFHRLYGLPRLDQLDELRRVLEFRERLSNEGLTCDYDTEEELGELAMKHLSRTVKRLKTDADERQAIATNYGDEPVRLESDPETVEVLPAQQREQGIDLLDLRLKLDAKLAWLSKHLLAGPDTPTFANVGSLAYDGYLPSDQARRAARLLAFDPGTVEDQDPSELQSFARAADQDVSNFRATVFDGYVRKVLEGAGWSLEDFEQQGNHRPDFLVNKHDRSYRIAPRFVTSRQSRIRDLAVARLERTRNAPPSALRRIVVIPDRSGSPTSGPAADPQVTKLGDLLSTLET